MAKKMRASNHLTAEVNLNGKVWLGVECHDPKFLLVDH